MSVLEGLPTPDTTTTATAAAQIPTAANGYIPLPVTVDPNQLMADAFGFVMAQFPGWQPYEGQLEVAVLEACAQMVAAYAQVAAQVPLSVFAYFGAALVNVPPNNGSPAQAPTTWTMVDAKGYVIPAGTTVAYQVTGNSYTLFQTTADVTVPTGSTATASGAVTVEATTVGAANNGIAAGPLVLVDSLAYVASVVSTEPTSGGADPETLAAYLGRLSDALQLLSPRPVLASDFAALSVGQQGCARALGIDNFDALANMLAVPDDAFATGVGSWAGITNCAVAQSTAEAQQGTHSLAVTATATGAFVAATNSELYPCSPGSTYAAVTSSRAAATPETMSAVLRWRDATGALISTTTGTGVADTTSGWTALVASGTAPANAATVEVGISGTAAASAEVHYVGEAALFYVPSGASVPAWGAGGAMTGQERMVTVVPVDASGDALSPSAMEALATYLGDMREVNFVVNIAPPTFAPLAVVCQVAAVYGSNLDTVQAAVQAALTTMLSPANWAGGSNTPPVWLDDPTVRYLDVAATVRAVTGVHHIVSLTLNGGTSDVTMGGYAPLPSATLTVTAVSASAGT